MSLLLDKMRDEFKAKKVLIVGLGLQGGGVGLAKFFADLGAVVKVTDLKTEKELKESLSQLKDYSIEYSLGEHKDSDFLNADIIFKGPSVRWDLPKLKKAEEKNIPIEMEVSFFASNCPAKIIGITGTRGKSTTSMMVFEVLKDQEKKVHLGGNISGLSTIELLKNVNESDLVVLELSSWGLSGFHKKKMSPQIAIFTNFYSDHLNYYSNLDEYLYDKKAIYLYQKKEDFLIANQKLKPLIEKDNINGELMYFSKEDYPGRLEYLIGEHNEENAAAVFMTAKVLNLDLKKAEERISKFKTLKYRGEKIGEKDGVIFINDSTSTTPIATIKAINSLSDKPIVLIMGGNSKKLPFDELLDKINDVDSVFLLEGTFTREILSRLKKIYEGKLISQCNDLEDALIKSFERAKSLKESYLLFSPGATSFANFKNEFDRGDAFNLAAKKIYEN